MSLCLPSVLKSTKMWMEKYPKLKIIWVLPLAINFELFNSIIHCGSDSLHKRREIYHSMMYYNSIKSLTRKWLFNMPEVAMISLVDLFLNEDEKSSFVNGKENLQWPTGQTWNGLNVLPEFADTFWKHLSTLTEGMNEQNFVLRRQLQMREKITKNEIPKLAQQHPMYNLMWEKFWADRSLILRSIDVDPQKFDFTHEWNYKWNSICQEFGRYHNCSNFSEYVGPALNEKFCEFLRPHIGNLQQRININVRTPDKNVSDSVANKNVSNNANKRSFSDSNAQKSPKLEKKMKVDTYSPKTPPRVQKDSSKSTVLANKVFTKLIKFINHLDFLGPAIKYTYRLFMNNLNDDSNSSSLFENSLHVIVIQAALSMMLNLFTKPDLPYEAIDMAMCIEACQELLLYIGAPDESDASIQMMATKKFPEGILTPQLKSELYQVEAKASPNVQLSDIPLPSSGPSKSLGNRTSISDAPTLIKMIKANLPQVSSSNEFQNSGSTEQAQSAVVNQKDASHFSDIKTTVSSYVSGNMDSDMRTLNSGIQSVGSNINLRASGAMDSDMRVIPGANVLSHSRSVKPDQDMRVFPYELGKTSQNVATSNKTNFKNCDSDMRVDRESISQNKASIDEKSTRLQQAKLAGTEKSDPRISKYEDNKCAKNEGVASSEKDIESSSSKTTVDKLKEGIFIDTQSNDPSLAKSSKLVMSQMLPRLDSVADLTKGYSLTSVEEHIKISLGSIGLTLSPHDMEVVMKYISNRQGKPAKSEAPLVVEEKKITKLETEEKKVVKVDKDDESKKDDFDMRILIPALDSIALLTKGFPLPAIGPHVKIALQNMGKVITDRNMEKIIEYIANKHKELLEAEKIVRDENPLPVPCPKPLPESNPPIDKTEIRKEKSKVKDDASARGPLSGWNIWDPSKRSNSVNSNVRSDPRCAAPKKEEEAEEVEETEEPEPAKNLTDLLSKLKNMDPSEQASLTNYLAKLEGQVINLQKAVDDKKKKNVSKK